jgi:hypothetical protein
VSTNLYETDHAAWALQQATFLRHGNFSAVDVEHLSEELEAVMGNDRRELHSRFRILIAHLLKWQYQQDRRSPSWEATIRDSAIALLIP